MTHMRTLEVPIKTVEESGIAALVTNSTVGSDLYLLLLQLADTVIKTTAGTTDTFSYVVTVRQLITDLINEDRTNPDKNGPLIKLLNRCNDLLRPVLEVSGEKSVLVSTPIGRFEVERREPSKGRETLDRVKLLDAGVTPEQIQKGTKTGEPGKPGLMVRKVKENG